MAYTQWNNKAALIGRIANEVEMKKTPNGNSVVNINLAVEKNKDQTDFFSVSAVEHQIKCTKKIKLNAKRNNVKFNSIQII